MLINNIEYNGMVKDFGKEIIVVFDDIDLKTIANFPDVSEIEYNGLVYSVSKISNITRNQNSFNVSWSTKTPDEYEKEELVEEIKVKNIDISEKAKKIEAVKKAIRDILVGIPTITEYIAFVKAVKEAVNYDGNNQ